MKKYPIFILMSFILLEGCDISSESKLLNKVDSLVVAEKYDSAYHLIQKMNPRFDNEMDMAHYQLLLTQTSYLTYNTLSTDTAIDGAIAYYEKSDDMEKLADVYYYKASCLHERHDDSRAIHYYKKAEEVAEQSKNLRLKYKIAESMVRINNQNGNYSLQLSYARKALQYALDSGNKNWMAYSYFNMSRAFQNIGNVDSLTKYTKELIPRLGDIYPEDLPYFLSCIGFMYFKNGDLENAKKYYKEALTHKEVAQTMVNLADVYVEEGNEEEAYRLWQKAFLSVDEGDEKDIIMFNMLQYDLEHHKNLEDACERMFHIFTIKDSMTNTLKDRTIQDLQQKYDEEALNHLYKSRLMKWMIATLALIVVILIVIGYVGYKRYHSKLLMAKHQMLINQYINEIDQLSAQCNMAQNDISYYKAMIDHYKSRICLLNSSGENAEKEIEVLNKRVDNLVRDNKELEKTCLNTGEQIRQLRQKITDIVEKASPMLNRGKILNDDILQNKTTVSWSKDDYICFVEYYKALHIKEYENIENDYNSLTYHNAFFLILNKMGKNHKEISQIMGISPESIRTIKHRLQKKLRA